MFHRLSWLTGLFLSLLLHSATGWAQSKNLAPGFTRLPEQARVVIMPADVELFSISAGGVQEPRADWTEQAQKHLQQELLHQRSNLARQVSPLKSELQDPMAELNGLHGAVAQSIFLHHIQGISKLPTKNGELRWTLGEAVKDLRDQTQADYALFVWIRDSYASAERKAAMIAMAFLGVGLTGGAQVGYASLVNLKDGQVVWFNALNRASGDLREAKAAEETVQVLLRNFPRAP
ncbi:hypothetical protein [Limnohabitans sp. Hippo3]|jgi:hypothetical protein|uniref:hypothetical protein n=1 Tax=unclassified Limnohabitans TaxID=2626134 RepID=UPI000D35319B|nr:hypothetical protein [Limnohabitans sp. Hippo3]PUE41963.1 hypothetical protein B9Z34_04430 [Limnohabitans sp. Hippo3]